MIERLKAALIQLFGHHNDQHPDLLTPQPIRRDELADRVQDVPDRLHRLKHEFPDLYWDVQINLSDDGDPPDAE